MNPPTPLAQLQLRALDDEAAFRRTLDVPLLVWTPTEKEPATGPMFATRTMARVQRPEVGEPLVFRLAKSASANAFGLGITVGRSENNDLWLDDHSVSRFHAWFQKGEDDAHWLLCDAESRNGSWIGAEKLRPNRPAPISDGSRLRFGDLELAFYLPDSFVAWVRGRSAR